MSTKPKKIVVIRHAEKPIREGDQKLSSIGMHRAQNWAMYIPNNFGTPDTLFATAASKASLRPIMTIMPLFELLEATPLDVSFPDEDAQKLASLLIDSGKHAGQNIVVCWHHGKIPDLLKGLGAKHHEYPDPWPEDDFGTALVVTFEQDEPTVTKFKM